jgi:hypothetical protein
MTNTEKTNKSTHRGTCQACGRVQCVTLHKDTLAKHGYTVDWGYFNGVCQGAEAKPLEVERTLTDAIIEIMHDKAARADKVAADLKSGAVAPTYFKSHYNRATCKTERIEVSRDELMPFEQDQCLSCAIHRAESEARGARYHATTLTKLIETRHGQPLVPVASQKRQLVVGDRIKKWGDIYEVTEIRYQVASGCGPYLNGHSILHAIIRRDDGRTVAIPVRSIRSSIIEKGGAS